VRKVFRSDADMDKTKIKEKFIEWYLTIPDVDETLIAEGQQAHGCFRDYTVMALYEGFKAGYASGRVYKD
jgi:hypothetical protein